MSREQISGRADHQRLLDAYAEQGRNRRRQWEEMRASDPFNAAQFLLQHEKQIAYANARDRMDAEAAEQANDTTDTTPGAA